jgi:hypothetical protein
MLPKTYMSCAQRKTNICTYLLIILLLCFINIHMKITFIIHYNFDIKNYFNIPLFSYLPRGLQNYRAGPALTDPPTSCAAPSLPDPDTTTHS